jgi:hypothetical protein
MAVMGAMTTPTDALTVVAWSGDGTFISDAVKQTSRQWFSSQYPTPLCTVESARAALAAQAETHKAELKRMQAEFDKASLAMQDEINAVQGELDQVLGNWNALVAATGSKTNGGAVGHVTALRAQHDAQQVLLQRCLESMRHAVTWEETGQGRPPSQTCLFEIQDAQKALAARTGGKA